MDGDAKGPEVKSCINGERIKVIRSTTPQSSTTNVDTLNSQNMHKAAQLIKLIYQIISNS